MNIRELLVAIPLLRRVWRWLPPPLRWVAAVITLILGIRRLRQPVHPEGTPSADGSAATDAARTGTEPARPA